MLLRGLKRHRQVSLRSLFCIVGIAAIWFCYLARSEAKRRKFIDDIRAAGGVAVSDESSGWALFASSRVSDVTIPHDSLREIGVRRLELLPRLNKLTFTGYATPVDGGVFSCDLVEYDFRRHGNILGKIIAHEEQALPKLLRMQ